MTAALLLREYDTEGFVKAFSEMQREAHALMVANGFWDLPRNDGEAIALMHSELSEALDALRHGNPPDDKIPAFSGLEAELADTILRIMDLAQARGLRLAEALAAKHHFNASRPRKHGKQF